MASRLRSLWPCLQGKFLAILLVFFFRPPNDLFSSFILSFMHQAFIEHLLSARFCAGRETNTIQPQSSRSEHFVKETDPERAKIRCGTSGGEFDDRLLHTRPVLGQGRRGVSGAAQPRRVHGPQLRCPGSGPGSAADRLHEPRCKMRMKIESTV